LDLGASYALTLDFSEAFNWLETAKNLNPQDSFILEKIEETKRIKKEFEKFSEKEKRIMKEMREDPQELKFSAIQNLLTLSQEYSLTPEDFENLKEEIKLAGFNPQIFSYSPPSTEEEINLEYIKFHQKVPEVERKISPKEFEEIKEKLLDKKTENEELKKCLLILAHQGTKEALSFLREYLEKAPKNLKDWAKLALKECELHSQAKPGQIVKIIH
jgi:hypothetical protein